MSIDIPLQYLSKKDIRGLNYAARNINSYGPFDLGAAILNISGSNNYLRACLNGKQITSLHAEIDAITKYQKITNRQVNGQTLYVCRIAIYNKVSKFANAKPCTNCMKFIKQSGIKTIKYTDCRDNVEYLCTIKI